MEALQGWLTPVMLVPFVLIFVTRYVAGTKHVPPLVGMDRFLAGWAIFNGAIIHSFLDGLIGVFGLVKPLAIEYAKLDKRYPTHEPNVLHISLMELFIYTPLCLWWYVAIVKRQPVRHALNLVVSCIQLYGTIIFAGVETYNGFPNIPWDPVNPFSGSCLFYFWLSFVIANPIWIIIPLIAIVDAFRGISKGHGSSTHHGKRH